MNRSLKSAALTAALATAALVSVPATASADAYASTTGPAPVIACDGNCQIAGGSIFNAGHDNIVGSGDVGDDEAPGAGFTVTHMDIQAGPNGFPLRRVSLSGNASYPEVINPDSRTSADSRDASSAVYEGNNARLQINVDSQGMASCSAAGFVGCSVINGGAAGLHVAIITVRFQLG